MDIHPLYVKGLLLGIFIGGNIGFIISAWWHADKVNREIEKFLIRHHKFLTDKTEEKNDANNLERIKKDGNGKTS